jgi:hypothetical protein
MPIRGDRLRWPPRPGKRSSGTRETLSTDERKPAPRQPNERDASADSQASEVRPVIKQAHEDITAGQVDTDCRTKAGDIVDRNETTKQRRRNQ